MYGRGAQRLPESWTQLALPTLGDDDETPPRWSVGIVALDARGRVTLPGPARRTLGAPSRLRVATRGDALLLRPADTGTGTRREVRLDGRGRVVVPVWLREAAGPSHSVLVAARTDPGADPVVVLAPTRVLARVVDRLVGER